MFGPGWAQAEVTAAAESPISVGVLAVHERPELVDKLWQLITTPLHGLLQHVVYGFTIVVCPRAAPCRGRPEPLLRRQSSRFSDIAL